VVSEASSSRVSQRELVIELLLSAGSSRKGHMRGMRSNLLHNRSGQSLIETALLLPIMLTIVCNAVNIGYFFYVALNLATASRQGVEYSIQGPASFQQLQLPSGSSISSLVYGDITGAMPSTVNTPTQVCSLSLGLNLSGKGTATQVPNCASYGRAGSFTTQHSDPEAPYLVLNRVGIQYTVTPLIPGTVFNVVLPPSLTFIRVVEMRVME
jgi:Flp pilus assembly protein TadG